MTLLTMAMLLSCVSPGSLQRRDARKVTADPDSGRRFGSAVALLGNQRLRPLCRPGAGTDGGGRGLQDGPGRGQLLLELRPEPARVRGELDAVALRRLAHRLRERVIGLLGAREAARDGAHGRVGGD